VHALITEGAFHPTAGGGGEFERVQWWDLKSLTELYRRMVLRSLREAERLRGETEEMLLSWQHPGFHVHATEPVLADDKERQEHLARYITRAPLRLDAVKRTEDRQPVKVRTPPDPVTGRTVMELDRLELIRRLCTQCGVEMRPVSVIREVKVVDRILGHLWRVGGNDPWEGTALRGPPSEPIAMQ